jgi:hypothetical protein
LLTARVLLIKGLKPVLKPKKGITTINTPLATCWLESRTLCVVTNDEKRDAQKMSRHFEMLQNILQSRHCCIVELKYATDYSDEVKAMISGRLHNMCNALALIVKREARHAGAAEFLKDYPDRKIPVKLFTSEKAARFWLGRKLLERKQTASEHS